MKLSLGKKTARLARPLAAPDQAHRLVALEQIEADPRRLPARAGEAAVAIEQQLGIALGDWRELRDVLGLGDTECDFAGLARAEVVAGAAQPQVCLLGEVRSRR